MTVEQLALNLAARMREIDSAITCSAYNGGDDDKDRPPGGDDYNLLWDAILDEFITAGHPILLHDTGEVSGETALQVCADPALDWMEGFNAI
jgi:hypothetical protein